MATIGYRGITLRQMPCSLAPALHCLTGMMLTHAIDLTTALTPVPVLLGTLVISTAILLQVALSGRRRRTARRRRRLRLATAAAYFGG